MLRDLPQGDRDFLCGEDSPQNVAHEWAQQGFTLASMREWALGARCFRPEAARALTVLGLNPEAAKRADEGGDTFGYLVANGDMSPQDAQQLNVANGQKVSVRSNGERQLTFDEVVVRVRDDFALEFHIDTEEANAAGLKNGAQVTLIA